jgi:hypothetical protein
VLIWDALGNLAARGRPAEALAPEFLKKRWADLGSEDAGAAYQAVRALARAPTQAVELIAKQLAPVPLEKANQIRQLIVELDHDRFTVRQNASAKLEVLGEAAEDEMRAALKNRPTLEVRIRLDQLVEKLDLLKSPVRLRALRAVEVLEHIGTPAACEALQTLSRGAPQARLTQEARASLQRLARRATADP